MSSVMTHEETDFGLCKQTKMQISCATLQADEGLSFVLPLKYLNDPKFSDRLIWANSADPDQTAL